MCRSPTSSPGCSAPTACWRRSTSASEWTRTGRPYLAARGSWSPSTPSRATRYLIGGELPAPGGTGIRPSRPTAPTSAATAIVQIAVGNDAIWRRFAPLIGLDADDARFVHQRRPAWAPAALDPLIGARLASEPRCGSGSSGFAEHGVPAGEVRSLDRVYASQQVRSQGLIVETEHATLGSISTPGPPLRFGRSELATTPPRRRWASTPTRSGRGSTSRESVSVTPRVILAIDQGTTGTACLVFDREGRDPRPGVQRVRAALPAARLGRARCRRDLGRHATRRRRGDRQRRGRRRRAAGIGITNQRETVVAWDRGDGRAASTARSSGRTGARPRAATS